MNEVIKSTTDVDQELLDRAVDAMPWVAKGFFRTMTRWSAESGWSVGQCKALFQLHHHGPATMKELAGGLGLSLAATSEMVERLVADGLAIREAHPLDRRQVLVSLTPRAAKQADLFQQQRRAQFERLFHQISPSKRVAFVAAIEMLAATLNAEDPPPVDRVVQSGRG